MKKTQKSMQTGAAAEEATLAEISAELQALGFSAYEARCYLALVRSSPATAYDVSKTTGVPRANVYGALENLAKKGAVQKVGQRPASFAAVPVRELMTTIARATSSRCDRITSLIKTVDFGENPDIVWTVKGKERVHDKISDMIDRARTHIWIKSSEEIVAMHEEGLRRAAERGVRIIIILFGQGKDRFRFGRVYLHEGDGIRIGTADNLFTLTIDYAEAITVKMQDDYLGAYTRSGPMVTMAETIIRHDVYIAEIFSLFGAEIREAFGPHLFELRKALFSPEQLRFMNERFRELGLAEDATARPPA